MLACLIMGIRVLGFSVAKSAELLKSVTEIVIQKSIFHFRLRLATESAQANFSD